MPFPLQVAKNIVGGNAFGRADLAEYRAEQAKANGLSLGNWDAVFDWGIAFHKNMTAALPVCSVVPIPDEMLDQAVARQTAWRLQATASSSASTSFTRAGLLELS